MSTTVAYYNFIVQQMNIFVGLSIYSTGIIGSILNIIIFTSLKTFRQTSCGFYLTLTSVFNLGQTIFALTTRILDSGFSINLTNLSWSCKCRTYLAQSCVLLSLTTMSLAMIDQFISMGPRRQWSSRQLARRHLCIACVIWFAHGVSAILFWDTPTGTCVATGTGYRRYLSQFYLPILLGCLPIAVMTLFGLLSFCRIRTSLRREMNMVRLSHERQLSAMALSQVFVIIGVSIPYTIFNIYDLNVIFNNPVDAARHRLVSNVVVLLYYEHFAVSFFNGPISSRLKTKLDAFLEFILRVLLCFSTISQTVGVCPVENSCQMDSTSL